MIKRPQFTRSIRFRMTAFYALLTSAILAAGAVLLVFSVHSHLVDQVDRTLVSDAHYVRTQIAQHNYIPPTGPAGQYGELLEANGKPLGIGDSLHGVPLPVTVTTGGPVPRLTTIQTGRFGPLRVLEVQLGRGSAPVLVEAVQINQIAQATHSLTVGVAIGAPLLALVLSVLVWVITGRALRPVETARAAVASISDANLSTRIPSPRTGDEVERLVGTMNAMLDRQGAAIERELRFIADASHELRSPITAARAALESEAAGSDADASREVALRALGRLHDLADQLLVLDSVTRGTSEVIPVDLDDLIFSYAGQLRPGTALHIDTSAVSGGQVYAKEVDIIRIIENLGSNAVRHVWSQVVLSLSESADQVELSVADDGPGVPDASKTIIFERFYRLDSDRSRAVGGAGLGLAIVRELTLKYGGSVRVEDASPCGARFVVRLPTSPTEPAINDTGLRRLGDEGVLRQDGRNGPISERTVSNSAGSELSFRSKEQTPP